MDILLRKIAYIYLIFTETIVNLIVFIYSFLFVKHNKSQNIKKIAAYWYNPYDLTGSNIRMGEWKHLFETDIYIYDNFYINTTKEAMSVIEGDNWTKRYLFFAKCFWRRLPQILKAHNYDTIWISRGIIPFYPRKSAFIEKCLKKVVSKLVVDTTDGGDYSSNPHLMENTLKQANEITVAYKFQKEMYEDRFKVNQIYWTIPTKQYIKKTNYEIKNIPIVGWMGSPANFNYIIQLLPILQEIVKQKEFIFRYICRKNFDKELVGIKTEHYFYGDDYYKIIASFDIGLSPFLEENVRTKGKIAMKHQEFMLCGIPQVCSTVAISEFVENEKEVLIAKNIEDWKPCVLSLLNNEELRTNLGNNSVSLFNKYYLYESQYEKLKKVLTNN